MPNQKMSWRTIVWPNTLKGRLWILLVFMTFTPITLIGITSYYWMYKAQEEKIGFSYQSIVNTKRDSLESLFANLSSVSQLLVVDGGLGDDIIDYIESDDPVQKTLLFKGIDKFLTNIIFSNPNVSGLLFYFPEYDNHFQFESTPLHPEFMTKEGFQEHKFPTLFIANQMIYQGPHPSVFANQFENVFSLVRKIEYRVGKSYYIYLETQFNSEVNNSYKDNKVVLKQILVDKSDKVLYSQIDEVPIGSQLVEDDNKLLSYKSFETEGANGWKLLNLIAISDYEKGLNQWQFQFILMTLLSLILTAIIIAIIWRMIYRPLNQMNREFKRFSYNQFEMPVVQTRLQEFNSLFNSFQLMRKKILELLSEVETKERRKAELEVEKLMSQINPHFLHNTLNTIQFLALEKGQKEIFDLVKVFTRVLHYNLAKSNMIVTIQEEVGALQDYIELQNIRYDHRFSVTIQLDSEIETTPIPRFVLQPLVENALYHGLQNDQGTIHVTVGRTETGIFITVADNGKGIAAEKLHELLEEDNSQKSGLGIGLKYVRKMLEVYFGGEATMSISSVINEGTIIKLHIPASLKGWDSYN